MTVRADCRAHVSPRDGFRVHAFLVSKQRPIADTAALHYVLIAMTAAAGLGDVCPVDGRLWIAGRQHGRHVAITRVTIQTTRGFGSRL